MFQTPSKCSTLAPPTYFVAHLCKFTWVWRGCAKYIRAATSISNFVNGLWHRQNNSTRGPWFRRRPRRKRERKESGATEPRRRLEDSQTIFKTSNFQVYKNWSVCHERRPIWDSSSVKSSWNGCINQKKKKTDGQEIERWWGERRRWERSEWKKSQRERKRQYRFNLVIVPAFLNPFKKKGSLSAVSLSLSLWGKSGRISVHCHSRYEKQSAPVTCTCVGNVVSLCT